MRRLYNWRIVVIDCEETKISISKIKLENEYTEWHKGNTFSSLSQNIIPLVLKYVDQSNIIYTYER